MDIEFVFAVTLALVFAISIDIEALTLIPQEKWFSFTGGVSTAYVVLDILPRIGQSQVVLNTESASGSADISIYCVMVLGILTFHGLEQLAWRSRKLYAEKSGRDRTSPIVCIASLAVFTIYILLFNLLQVGYKFEFSIIERSLLLAVLILHFIVINDRLTGHHKRPYRRIGRWVIIAGLLISSVMSEFLLRSTLPFNYLWAFVAGGLLISGLQTELSPKHQTCFWSFGFGTVVFSIVLILL
ncbi:MAG: hypothetical protein AAFR31_20985 [Cyanobacteria bacterium J06627_8]